jgi:hypothetical protein
VRVCVRSLNVSVRATSVFFLLFFLLSCLCPQQQSVSYGFEDKKVKRQQTFRTVHASSLKVTSSHLRNKYTQNVATTGDSGSSPNSILSEPSRGELLPIRAVPSSSQSRGDPNGKTRMSATAPAAKPAANARTNARAASGPGSQSSRPGRL